MFYFTSILFAIETRGSLIIPLYLYKSDSYKMVFCPRFTLAATNYRCRAGRPFSRRMASK